MSITIVIIPGELEFPTQTSALSFFKEMLGRYNLGDRLNDLDARHLLALLQRHRNHVGKIGCGVRHFEVRRPSGERDRPLANARSFHVVRDDGTIVDFSYIKAIKRR